MINRKLMPALLPVILILISVFSGAVSAEETKIRVLLLENQYAVRIASSHDLSVKDAYSLKKVAPPDKNFVVKAYKGKVFANKTDTGSKFVYIASDDIHHTACLNGVPYRGYFLVGFNNRGALQVINYVALDDYIQGVLGGEIISSWPLEAIKAQAVAARTYVAYKLQNCAGKLYDVVNDTGDQMYVGVRGESSLYTRAVRETRNQVLARDGKPICAYYHSNCGGGTSNSWNVFPKDKGALRGVKCPYCAGTPNSSWGKTLYGDTIRHRLNRNGYKIGRIFNIEPFSRGENKRVIYLKITHEQGSSFIFASEFRRIMGYRTIKSTKFDVHPKSYVVYRQTKQIAANRSAIALTAGSADSLPIQGENIKIPTYFYFSGAGWGHGAGMCQWGARGMALQGNNYTQILSHYYPGTTLCKITKE